MENNEKDSIGVLIEEETKKRLDTMASSNYQFPEHITVLDKGLIIAGVLISMVLIVLCMTGVIA